ncbi:MAG: PilZ domain-containing protein [Candidatus Omnitrophica bacterium]|nr:PilZ domain-containing protein [Candidatus Omnitrophota bacterium]
MKEERQQDLKHRVITMLNRQQVDFLDKIGKDALFSTGRKFSHNEILQALVDFAFENGFDGENVRSANDFKEKSEELMKKKASEESAERRKFPRISQDLQLACRILESCDTHTPAETTNVSACGIQLILPRYFAPAARLELSIKAKDETNILMFGRVAWTKEDKAQGGFVTGIELTYVSDKEKFFQDILKTNKTYFYSGTEEFNNTKKGDAK